jgi:tetratricopeptide (TPR) repeat protein
MKRAFFSILTALSLIFFFTASACSRKKVDYYNAGLTAHEQGNYDDAIHLFSEAIKYGDLTPGELIDAYYKRGLAWLNKGDYEKGISDLSNTIDIDPTFAGAYYHRGNALADMGDYDKAISDYTKAIEINPKDGHSYYNRATVWEIKGEYDKALADITKSIEIDPRDSAAYEKRGIIRAINGDYKKATADFTKSINMDPGRASAYYNRGISWDKRSDYKKAISDITKAIEIAPMSVRANTGLAWIMATCPDKKYRNGMRAVELAEKALRINEVDYVLNTLAAAYAEAGRFQEAVESQEKAIEKLKESGNLKDMLKYEKRLQSYKAGKPWRDKEG